MDGRGGPDRETVIEVEKLTVALGGVAVLDGLDLKVYRGEILGVVGGSGSGKSVLLRSILSLLPRLSGEVRLFDVAYDRTSAATRTAIDRRIGVMFQNGALFSSLTVLQNVEVPMREHLNLPPALMADLARLKIELVGLPREAAGKHPAELSGGMVKRAALARALALDPEVLFLDEPTSGLDPISAAEFDQLIGTLRDTLNLTVMMVTHDLDSLSTVCDRIACLAEGRILVDGSIETMLRHEHPWVRSYFRGARARHVLA